jgi:YidC/Oxa1 family membrane protein insertase
LAEFSNPNQQGGGQDNKSLLAMLVVFLVAMVGIQIYHMKYPQSPANQTASAPSSQAAAAPAAQPPYVPAAASATAAPSTSAAVSATPAVEASAETTTVVENELYKITFSNRGADVVSWLLKKQTDSSGHPLDLINQQAAKLVGYPLSLYTQDGATLTIASASRSNKVVTASIAGQIPSGLSGRAVAIAGVADSTYNGTYTVTQTGPNTLTYTQSYGDDSSTNGGTVSTLNGATGAALSQALFVPSATGALAVPGSLTFKYSANGLSVTKTFTFDDTYVLHAQVETTRDGAPIPVLLAWPGGFGDQNDDYSGSGYSSSQFDSYRNGSDAHLAPKKISGGAVLSGPYDWAGVSDPFFAAVFLPASPATAQVATLYSNLDASRSITRVGFGSGSAPSKAMNVPLLGVAIGDANGAIDTGIFAGPKAIDVLRNVHAANPKITLASDLEFGFWGFIGKYLFLALQFINAHIASNWGWDIVILTVILQIAILPSRVKMMRNAVKMQKIQPQVDAIKAKYKNPKMNDPKYNQMSQEVMDFQKAQGINMFGGCIPQLITFPLIYAFYAMIRRVVELRHAHWLWVPDLQSADPTHILPILTILFQFLMQYYTPSPGVDQQQQKMMAFMMPAFFGYICWHYASGLALYWLIGLLIGIAQQMIMNRTSLGKEMRDIAAKRARRGQGKTIQAKR